MRYVALARGTGATPILVTPLARRKFDAHGQLLDTHGLYAQAVRELAAREQVGLIDLDATQHGLAARARRRSLEAVLHARAGAGPGRRHPPAATRRDRGGLPGGGRLEGAGSRRCAKTVVRDTDCGARATALADRAAQAHPSQVVHEARHRRGSSPARMAAPATTTAYPFFADAPGLSFFFRKRVLHKGAGIGLHQHDKDEIYYVVSGTGPLHAGRHASATSARATPC